MGADTSEEKVVLSAVDQFTAVFKQAKQSVDQLKGALDGARDTLAGIGITVGGGALVKLHLDALAATAALNDMSQQAGASVEGLSAIQNVAKVGGQDFNGFVDQLGRMVKGLKQQGEEGTKAGAAFAYLGIQTKDANGRFRDTSAIVVELAQKLATYEDGGNKVALVQDALGKGAERYIPLLAEIAKNTDLVSKATGAQAEQANEAEKNMRRLQLTMEDSRRELVNSLTPAIIDFTNQLLGAVKATGGFWSGVGGLSSVTGGQTADPLTAITQLDAKLKTLKETKASLSNWDNPGAALNMIFSPEDLKIVDQQIAYAEKQRAVLQQILVQRVKGNTAGMVEDAAGNIVPAPAAARLAYQSPDTKRGRQPRMTPYDTAALEMEQRQALEASGQSEFMKTSLAIKSGKYDSIDQVTGQVVSLTQAEKNYLLQLAAAADTERDYKQLREDKLKADAEIAKNDDAIAASRRSNFAEIVQQFKTERQIAEDRYNAELDQLHNSTASQEEFNDYSMRLWQRHQENLTRIQDEETKKRYNISQVYRQLDLQSAGSFFGYMSLLMNTKSREMFEIGKAAAISKAVVDTYAAATGAYKAMADIPVIGPALGIAAAAAAVAAGLQNVSAIESTAYGSKGGGAIGTFSASPITGLPTGSPAPQAATSTPQNSQTTVVHVHGTPFDSELIRNFVEALNENARDGGRILLAGN